MTAYIDDLLLRIFISESKMRSGATCRTPNTENQKISSIFQISKSEGKKTDLRNRVKIWKLFPEEVLEQLVEHITDFS